MYWTVQKRNTISEMLENADRSMKCWITLFDFMSRVDDQHLWNHPIIIYALLKK